jgi:predicted small integral membrane protein
MIGRPWLIPAAAALVAVVLCLAGAAAWDMTAPVGTPRCPANHICFATVLPDRHLHPLRAELLWAAAALFALVASGSRARRYAQAASRVLSGARSQ